VLLLNCGGISRGTFVTRDGKSCLLLRLSIGRGANFSPSLLAGSCPFGTPFFEAFSSDVSGLGIKTNLLSGFSSSFGHGAACSLAASANETSASSITGFWSMIPRSGGS